MLTWLGIGAILTLLALILFRVTSVVVALTLVPMAAAIAGGFAREVGSFALDGMRSVAPTAALLAFAVVYFGLMNDAGLFQPIVTRVTRAVGSDPLKVVVGTAVIATVAHLDGAGASTFMVTVPSLLPLYRRLRMDPLTLTCTTAMAAGTMNILPWGGPTTRAAAALQVGVADLFNPLIAATGAGIMAVFALAVVLGVSERRRARQHGHHIDPAAEGIAGRVAESTPARAGAPWWFNAALTIVTLAALVLEVLPLAVTFLIATAFALVVNYPKAGDQRDRLNAHGSAAMVMVTTVFAAGLFMGIMTKSGMLTSMARDAVAALPHGVLAHMPVLLGLASMPLSLAFDPDSFYFGVLPVLANASHAAGGSVVEVGRAALLGQMTTGFPVSPLTPATFLLVGLAEVDLADHQRRAIPYLLAISVVMTAAALLSGALHW
ncbi:MAG TPA: citrate:proton symporter [Vicinamibacterales bacterium]|nr:citrate:proton symporter [Vicinamibacterales bacterium]